MIRSHTALVLAGLLLPLAALAGCGSDSGSESSLDDATEVTYHFFDASVPPEYHRSYVVTASDGEVRIVVDSYGDVLHDEEASLDDATFESVVAEIDALEVSGSSVDDGCTGGTSSELTVTDTGGEVLREISTSSCGGDGEPDFAELQAVVRPLLAAFDMATLLAPDE